LNTSSLLLLVSSPVFHTSEIIKWQNIFVKDRDLHAVIHHKNALVSTSLHGTG